ncbi:1-pyrroline-5-carboxylate dehydrogenase [Candidatus Scalindua japonica]|uniref:L-glutamate gamma-semialdehyde dehydrogenase n=1 Tax=Candidatus Scalindua japonica TaxID=1284222 RepID=A0A286U1S7_9BACT|nr:L-glutamate gamma-semialdehyde dehydrogenase [Candidatus Scalindua japonica]GAX62100.1 1-pyrroline-5-carboxylate dehydrogenase [Candidatus Scalindua japonica]
MTNAKFDLNLPSNEPINSYAAGTQERNDIKAKLQELKNRHVEIPLIIGGKEVNTGNLGKCVLPHDHSVVVGTYHKAGENEVQMAIEAALKARRQWVEMDWQERASIFLKAANILAGPWRSLLNASTMLCQSKNVLQAEGDAACELIDFLRFNAFYAKSIYEKQPPISPIGSWNRLEYRPLEGFVFAVTPFNFTSIAANLASAPAIMGNVALWKPSSNSIYSSYFVMKLFQEAGVPDGVINFIPGTGSEIGPVIMNSPELTGIHFTGSSATFRNMWQTIGNNIKNYKNYPRIVGETGGKDFVFVHKDTGIEEVGTALIRGAFEYQGQKCSAASRAYIPRSLWRDLKEYILEEMKTVNMGDVENFSNFINAVIDEPAFTKISRYIEFIKDSTEADIICGGNCYKSKGYFIEPTIAVTTNPHFRTMEEEIFGPVITLYVYEDDKYQETLHLCDETSPYGLTGAVFSRDRNAIIMAEKILVNAAGNFYINDKPTGAAVGQQPFGGSRASGTNDKAGSYLNLLRWISPRTIKETFLPTTDYRYPFMSEG